MGDATGFYAATREFMAAWGRMPRPVLALTGLCALAAAVVIVGRGDAGRRRALAAARGVLAFGSSSRSTSTGCASGAAVSAGPSSGRCRCCAYRGLGFGLSEHVAWDFAFALSLAFVALTVVAVGYLGRNASGRTLGRAARGPVWAAWPLLVGAIGGHAAWSNNQWDIDVGLHAYSAAALDAPRHLRCGAAPSPRLTQLRLALAGCALSVATAVKLSNGLLAAAAAAVVFQRGRTRDASPFLAVRCPSCRSSPCTGRSYPKLFDTPVVASRPVRSRARRLDVDALVDVRAARARDRRPARSDRRGGSAAPCRSSRSCSRSCS